MTQPAPASPPRVRSGIIALSDGVRAFFAANAIPAVVTPVGWRYRGFQMNESAPGGGSRVCFIPGKIDPTAPASPKVLDAGIITQPTLTTPGPRLGGVQSGVGNPRPLAAFHKILSISIWGVDTSDTSNDELQLAATEQLLDWTYAAMHNAVDPVTGKIVGMLDIELTDAQWVVPPVDRAFGRELVLFAIAHGPIFDLPIGYTTPQAAIERGAVT